MHIHPNIKMYYELTGQGQPLVLIAGYGCDHTYWKPIQSKVSVHFQTLVIDNLGSGQTTDDRGELTLEQMADVIMMLIDQLQLKHPHIVGQSMGGALTQVLARSYGEKLGKIILLNTSAKIHTSPMMVLHTLMKLGKENISRENLLDVALPWFFSNTYLQSPANVEKIKRNEKNNPFPQSLDNQRRQAIALGRFDSHLWLHEIKKETLVIASENDLFTTPAEQRELAKSIPEAQLMIIPGGHNSVTEHPELVSQAITGFLLS